MMMQRRESYSTGSRGSAEAAVEMLLAAREARSVLLEASFGRIIVADCQVVCPSSVASTSSKRQSIGFDAK